MFIIIPSLKIYPMTTRSNTPIFFKVGVKTPSKAKNSVYIYIIAFFAILIAVLTIKIAKIIYIIYYRFGFHH
ncbi:hypothetical protein FDF44_00145 [Clostridium botulinum]|nr:hypothetical protein [Clostridium botulinum]